MPLKIVVCVKQVMDPETPVSAFKIDRDAKRVIPAPGIPPVVNGFDENAVEAALRLKDGGDAEITVVSAGDNFVMDVMKKPLSMGADRMVLVQDEAVEDLDGFATAYTLAEAIKKLGEYDLILCGRQASDWDNALVPLGIAEMLGLPCITTTSFRYQCPTFQQTGNPAIETNTKLAKTNRWNRIINSWSQETMTAVVVATVATAIRQRAIYSTDD